MVVAMHFERSQRFVAWHELSVLYGATELLTGRIIVNIIFKDLMCPAIPVMAFRASDETFLKDLPYEPKMEMQSKAFGGWTAI
jgi:hypothetical protein